MTPDTLERLRTARAAREKIVLVTRLGDGAQFLVGRDPLPASLDGPALPARSAVLDHEGVRYFVLVENPALRLVIVGAVHAGQALARIAGELGWAVSVVDPRPGFLTEARFPRAARHPVWPDALDLDAATALVTLSHVPAIDDPALASALASPSFYIGALGSRKTQAARAERLAARGFSSEALARIHGPVGLSIGAVGPAEIAVSIAAEIIQAWRAR